MVEAGSLSGSAAGTVMVSRTCVSRALRHRSHYRGGASLSLFRAEPCLPDQTLGQVPGLLRLRRGQRRYLRIQHRVRIGHNAMAAEPFAHQLGGPVRARLDGILELRRTRR